MTGQDTVQEWITGAGNTRDQKSKAARLTGSEKSAAPQESGGVCRETAGIIHKTGNGLLRAESIQKTDILGQKSIQQKGVANS